MMEAIRLIGMKARGLDLEVFEELGAEVQEAHLGIAVAGQAFFDNLVQDARIQAQRVFHWLSWDPAHSQRSRAGY